jgi:uncharacterized membrane protein YkoI
VRTVIVLFAALQGAQAAPDYAKMIKDAKLTLSEAVDKATKEVAGGTVVSGYMEENDGKPRYFIFVAKERKTIEVSIDLKEGTVAGKETLDDDDSKLVGTLKITLSKAIETALKKVAGKAVYADFDADEKGPPEAEVDVFADGKVTRVYIDAVTGEVTKTAPK